MASNENQQVIGKLKTIRGWLMVLIVFNAFYVFVAIQWGFIYLSMLGMVSLAVVFLSPWPLISAIMVRRAIGARKRKVFIYNMLNLFIQLLFVLPIAFVVFILSNLCDDIYCQGRAADYGPAIIATVMFMLPILLLTIKIAASKPIKELCVN